MNKTHIWFCKHLYIVYWFLRKTRPTDLIQWFIYGKKNLWTIGNQSSLNPLSPLPLIVNAIAKEKRLLLLLPLNLTYKNGEPAVHHSLSFPCLHVPCSARNISGAVATSRSKYWCHSRPALCYCYCLEGSVLRWQVMM